MWDILPEDTQKRRAHFAPYPEDLCKLPILATCPSNGVVLDPFCGTGTTMSVASKLGRKSVGIDVASEYIELAEQRTATLAVAGPADEFPNGEFHGNAGSGEAAFDG